MQNAECVDCTLAGKVTSVDTNTVDRKVEPDESICVSDKTSPPAEILAVTLRTVQQNGQKG
jgi:hypothetical protein